MAAVREGGEKFSRPLGREIIFEFNCLLKKPYCFFESGLPEEEESERKDNKNQPFVAEMPPEYFFKQIK